MLNRPIYSLTQVLCVYQLKIFQLEFKKYFFPIYREKFPGNFGLREDAFKKTQYNLTITLEFLNLFLILRKHLKKGE